MIIDNPKKEITKLLRSLKSENKSFNYAKHFELKELIRKLIDIKDGYEYIIWEHTK